MQTVVQSEQPQVVRQILLIIMVVVIWSPIGPVLVGVVPSPIFDPVAHDSGRERSKRRSAPEGEIGVEEIRIRINLSIRSGRWTREIGVGVGFVLSRQSVWVWSDLVLPLTTGMVRASSLIAPLKMANS